MQRSFLCGLLYKLSIPHLSGNFQNIFMRAAGEKQRSGTSLQRIADGIIDAFLVRIPVSMFMSRLEPVALFLVGLATPSSMWCGSFLEGRQDR